MQLTNIDIVIPPRINPIDEKHNHRVRNRNIGEIKFYDHMKCQDDDYRKRNQAERSIGRYKSILGDRLHSRELTRQRQEDIIGCSIFNKMIYITLGRCCTIPSSLRAALFAAKQSR